MNTNETNALAFKALAEPVRLSIISMLAVAELCACELLEKLSISQPTLSHHMKMLIKAGLVQSRKNATWIFYSINKESLSVLRGFISSLEQGPAKAARATCSPAHIKA